MKDLNPSPRALNTAPIHMKSYYNQMARSSTISHRSLLCIIATIIVSCCSSFVHSSSQTFPYLDYCHDLLQATTSDHLLQPNFSISASPQYLSFKHGFFHGGSPVFDSPADIFSEHTSNRIRLSIQNMNQQESGYYVVDGYIVLQNNYRKSWSGTVKGLWIDHSGELCMAACFQSLQLKNQLDCQVKIKFVYPPNAPAASITHPIFKGKLESHRQPSDPLFFRPIIVVAITDQPYVFTMKQKLRDVCASQINRDVPAHIEVLKDAGSVACELLPRFTRYLEVVWPAQCDGSRCNLSRGSHTASQQLQLFGRNIDCKLGMVHGFLALQGHSTSQLDILAVEGEWDSIRGQFCMVACNFHELIGDSLTLEPPDCEILVTLQFPTDLDLIFRYAVVGHVNRTSRNVAASVTFKPFSFRGAFRNVALGSSSTSSHMKYMYSSERLQQAQSKCQATASAANKVEDESKTSAKLTYPDGTVSFDFGFMASLKTPSGVQKQAYFAPLSIDNRIERFDGETGPLFSTWEHNHMNFSFDLMDMDGTHSSLGNLVSAEGVYERRTGVLCLVACRTINVEFPAQNASIHLEDGNKDCQVHATIHYPPTNPSFFGHHGIRGLIISLREQSDPFFFAPMTLTSDSLVYQSQIFSSINQIDSEIVMGLISLTMAGAFIALQLRHAKRHPRVLTHVSLLMLLVLTLGYLVQLVSNLHAMFPNRSRRNVWGGEGWLEQAEVLVRIMTTAVCLLLLRLMHVAWVSKGETQGSWYMERKVLYVCLTTYIIGGSFALSVSANRASLLLSVSANRASWLLGAMKAYAGLTIDFFLFPQVVGNCVWGVDDKILSPPFYFGMTLVRSMPHLYDIVRKSRFVPRISSVYLYADPTWDFYSIAWDAFIPCGALLLALLVFLQQRYSASFIFPLRWRLGTSYTKVSVTPL